MYTLPRTIQKAFLTKNFFKPLNLTLILINLMTIKYVMSKSFIANMKCAELLIMHLFLQRCIIEQRKPDVMSLLL